MIETRLTKTGEVRYRVLIRKQGYAPVSETFKKKSDAEKWRRKTLVDMDKRVYVADSKQPVRELFEKYRDEVTPRKPGARWEKVRLEKFLKTAGFMRQTVGQMSYRDMQAWRDARLKEVSDASVRRELNLISAVFTHARNEWHVAMLENPVSRCKRPANPKNRKRRVSQAEVESLWNHFDTQIHTKQSYIPWMFEFAIETGMRLGELCKLRWKDVNQEERWLYVLPSKNGDDRHVPLSDRALALLVGVRMTNAKDERVFPVNAGSTGTKFREACKTLGIVDLHFHDTRHEACSRLAKIFTLLELAEIIGHRDINSLRVYYNPTAAELASKFGGGHSPKPPHLQQPTAVCDQGASIAAVADPANDSHIDGLCSKTG